MAKLHRNALPGARPAQHGWNGGRLRPPDPERVKAEKDTPALALLLIGKPRQLHGGRLRLRPGKTLLLLPVQASPAPSLARPRRASEAWRARQRQQITRPRTAGLHGGGWCLRAEPWPGGLRAALARGRAADPGGPALLPTWACLPARTSTTSPLSAKGPTTASCCATGRRSSCAPCRAESTGDQAGQGFFRKQVLRAPGLLGAAGRSCTSEPSEARSPGWCSSRRALQHADQGLGLRGRIGLRDGCWLGHAGDGLTAQAAMLCNNVNCTDVFTTAWTPRTPFPAQCSRHRRRSSVAAPEAVNVPSTRRPPW